MTRRENLLSRAWLKPGKNRISVAHIFGVFCVFGDIDFSAMARDGQTSAVAQYLRKKHRLPLPVLKSEAEDIAAACFEVVETEGAESAPAARGAVPGNFAAALFLVLKNTSMTLPDLLAMPYSQFLQLLHAAVCASGVRCVWKYGEGSGKVGFERALELLRKQKNEKSA